MNNDPSCHARALVPRPPHALEPRIPFSRISSSRISSSLGKAVAERFRANPNLMEKLCRCYKHAMRSCSVHFAPMLPQMITHLVASFRGAPHCSFLYAGSICITEFGNQRAEYSAVLFEMIQSFSGIVFQNLQTLEQFTANPDMVRPGGRSHLDRIVTVPPSWSLRRRHLLTHAMPHAVNLSLSLSLRRVVRSRSTST
jgi:hypothetical protein